MSRHWKKRPKTTAKIRKAKQAKHAPFLGSEKEQVQWSFSKFDRHVWFDQQYQFVPFTQIAKHLKSYESMTWGQVRSDRDRDHPVDPDRIIAEAKGRLDARISGDFEELWRFRFNQVKRLWGLKIGPVFHVLWWDPQHKIYPTKKKRT